MINTGVKLASVLGAVFLLTGCGSTTVDLNKYITIETSGYDSLGIASYSFDYDAFNDDYADKIRFNSSEEDEISEIGLLSGKTSSELLLEICVSQSLSEMSELSNGDTIQLKWNCKDDAAKEYFNCKLDYSDIEYSVNNLKEVGTFDPFEHVDVSFSGISPGGSIIITSDNEYEEMQYISFCADNNYGLCIGDAVTVSASYNGSDSAFIEKFGTVLGQTEKIYVVDNLAYYASDVTDISPDMMDKMSKQGEDVFRAHVAKQWDKPENLKSVTLLGNYFLTAKAGMNASPNNYLYLIYKISAVNPEPEQIVDFYYYVGYSNIIILEDGTCSVDLSEYLVPLTGWAASETFQVGRYTYKGYENLESLFNNCIISKIDNYEYTSSIQE